MSSFPSTLNDLEYTYHFSKYTCSKTFYFIHLVFCYLIFLSGIACFITRLHHKIKFLHPWFGDLYIVSMLLATGTSLVIHNTGLPLAVLISFVFTNVSLIVGWILIKIHRGKLHKQAISNVDLFINKNGFPDQMSVQDLINKEKADLIRNRTIIQRIFSEKTFHGTLMFWGWLNIAGRVFASDQSGDFTCYTYAIYKPEYIGLNMSSIEQNCTDLLVPHLDPRYDRLPWANNELGWSLYLSLGPIAFGILVSVIWSVIVHVLNKKKNGK